MLFPNTKRMNIKISVAPGLDLWKTFQMYLAHEFIGKKSQGHQGTYSVIILELHVHTGTVFLHLCLQEGCVDNLLVIVKQKGGCL